jgi:hypothetical protein
MASKGKKAKAVAFSPIEVANIARANPYIQRLIEDAKLRDNVQKGFERSRSAYGRFSNGKRPSKVLLEDKRLQKDLREATEAFREAAVALSEAPKKRARKGRRLGRKLMILGLGMGLALVASEKLRSKVLDTLFGAEEEFEYTPPTAPSPSATPVSGAA